MPGRNGKRPFEPRIEQALGGEQGAQSLDAGKQLTDTHGANLGDTQRHRSASGVERELAEHTTTREPSVNGTGELCNNCGEHVIDSDMSADGSRRTRKAVRVPGRALIWVI